VLLNLQDHHLIYTILVTQIGEVISLGSPSYIQQSLESEYMALYAGTQEPVWLKGVIKELTCDITEPTPFLVDSQSAKDLAENLVFQKISKHIDITYYSIKEHVSLSDFETAQLHHCWTDQVAADIFTKSLSGRRVRSSKEREEEKI
jgi:hypothetical protein